MIVVEGPDGAGKSNLVARLVEDVQVELVPRAVSSSAEYQVDLCKWVDEHNQLGFGRRIYDRHQLISHPIYGPTMKRTLFGDFKNPVWLHNAWEKFWAIKPIVIFCLPPFEVVKANVLADETSKVAASDIEVYYWQYYTWTLMHIEKRWTWDYTAPNAKEFYGFMVAEIKRTLFHGGPDGRPR